MAELLAALTDLAPLDGDVDGVPRLPLLEALLSRAERRGAARDWRRWALARLGAAGLDAGAGPGAGPGEDADLPVGAAVAAAAGLAGADSGTWLLATPVHLYATLTHLRMHAAGPLPLTPAEAAAVAARFGAELAEAGVTMHAAGERLLLRYADALEVVTRDPAPWAGRDVGPAQPQGPDARRLRRLATELQMWLHDRPPAAPDRLPVNALWLWGAGAAPRYALRWPVLDSDDPLLAALHARDGRRVDDPGTRLATWRLAALGASGNAFAAAEERWFAPLARELGAGRLRRARVHYAGHEFLLRPWSRLRVWVRPRPWWELAS